MKKALLAMVSISFAYISICALIGKGCGHLINYIKHNERISSPVKVLSCVTTFMTMIASTVVLGYKSQKFAFYVYDTIWNKEYENELKELHES